MSDEEAWRAEEEAWRAQEAAWHAEADSVFAALLAKVEVERPAPGSRFVSELESEAAGWLVSLALRCDEREYVEAWCLRLGHGLPSGHPMLGLSGLCIGHLSRRFGCVSSEARALVEELAARCRRDPTDVDGNAISGLEDVESYAPRHPRIAKLARWPRRTWYRLRSKFGRS
ncbi:hypothetical protein FB559_3693 [Actinoallomurus bryophytorum]|uniref:Uncharacterized protein n=2 Tax=Actinoallomurus bryophytorum TaxID=1490222 RepID=A0A543CLU2_9ACTN|nr:hypothetical protein FB559_3693 [Actinoallomurus bryophytorum]